MSLIKRDSKKEESALVTKPSNTAIVSASNSVITIPKPKIKAKVLDEDTYIDSLEQIIQRDFFPDLPKLRTQLDWLQAEEGGNLEKMREIYGKLKSGSLVTPKQRPIETPANWSPVSVPSADTEPIQPSYMTDQQSLNTDMSLTKFQLLHTSEDNSSFDTLLEKQNINTKSKYSWLAEQGKEKEAELMLTSGKDDKAGLVTWDYKAKNMLMFNPEGAPMTDKEIKLANAGPARIISHENTRIRGVGLAVIEKKKNDDRVDLDEVRGLKSSVTESPKIGGYSVMLTPSPAPGVDQSPFMTWGAIEGTPLIVETDTPLRGHSGPTFKIPDVSSREKLVHDLVDQSARKHKKQKQDVRYTPTRSSVPSSPRTPVDHQLRASYASPSPRKTPRTPSTPNIYVTPKVYTPSRTPTKPM